MLIGPLLLEFGTHPHVAAATSTVMVLFSASSAALSFGFARLVNLQFALTFGLSCFVASLAGVLLVNRIIERSGKVRRMTRVCFAFAVWGCDAFEYFLDIGPSPAGCTQCKWCSLS